MQRRQAVVHKVDGFEVLVKLVMKIEKISGGLTPPWIQSLLKTEKFHLHSQHLIKFDDHYAMVMENAGLSLYEFFRGRNRYIVYKPIYPVAFVTYQMVGMVFIRPLPLFIMIIPGYFGLWYWRQFIQRVLYMVTCIQATP